MLSLSQNGSSPRSRDLRDPPVGSCVPGDAQPRGGCGGGGCGGDGGGQQQCCHARRRGVVGEDLAAVIEAREGPEAVESASGGTAAVGDVGESEATLGGDSGLVASSRDTPGSEMEVSSSGEGVTCTPHTPTVEELLAAAERAGGERMEGAAARW
ncbi:hypothetical protein RHMOL_Rhmol05G0153600 [Rhododendron molle]|uniref:Uncharacterized protein n=1 Tax=Rhododendron molle TaxID=49168 RepID=A0ACC0NPI3_RHOML|nr:hypothetical protein RHMOL_Rhmol05G0153600 [Rhododendron molle]